MARDTIRRMSDQNAASSMDLILPAFLTILGQAISTGSVEPEAMQDVVGSSLVALAYSRPNFGPQRGPGALATIAIGSSFKFRMAMNEAQGDPGEGIAALVAREIAFNAVTGFVAPLATNFMTSRVFGASPRSLDRDYSEGSRNVAGPLS